MAILNMLMNPLSRLIAEARTSAEDMEPRTLVIGAILATLLFVGFLYNLSTRTHVPAGKKLPPMIPYLVPFIGSMVSFGMNPLGFLKTKREQYGDTFTFLMFGRRMTYLLGNEGNNFVLNTCKLKEVSAEEAYRSLTVPVFGEGVVYDVPNHVLMEQKRFVKHGLSPENLRAYVPLIEKEARQYFARWKGETGTGDLGTAIAELTILTASRCLMGAHIRKYLSETVAELYCDLDKGFTPLNFLFPWLPLESYRKRDEAHIKMRELFLGIMAQRREKEELRKQNPSAAVEDDEEEDDQSDMMRALMDSEYRDGRKMTDREVACLMIALLMAGQHTSSTTGTWCLSYLATHPEVRKELLEEQKAVLGDNLGALDYDALKSMTLLDKCIRETLRLKPPIIAIMRKAMATVEYEDYVIPEGDYICCSPAVAQIDTAVWGKDAHEFNPHRFDDANPLLTDALGHGACSSYLPFGAGRHRCIGEAFAYIQLKTIVATFVQLFENYSMPEMPATDYTTLIVMPVKPVNVEFTRRKEDHIKADDATFVAEE